MLVPVFAFEQHLLLLSVLHDLRLNDVVLRSLEAGKPRDLAEVEVLARAETLELFRPYLALELVLWFLLEQFISQLMIDHHRPKASYCLEVLVGAVVADESSKCAAAVLVVFRLAAHTFVEIKACLL